MPKQTQITPNLFYISFPLKQPVPYHMSAKDAVRENYGPKANFLLQRKMREVVQSDRTGKNVIGLSESASNAIRFWNGSANSAIMMMPGPAVLRENRVTKIEYENIPMLIERGALIANRVTDGVELLEIRLTFLKLVTRAIRETIGKYGAGEYPERFLQFPGAAGETDEILHDPDRMQKLYRLVDGAEVAGELPKTVFLTMQRLAQNAAVSPKALGARTFDDAAKLTLSNFMALLTVIRAIAENPAISPDLYVMGADNYEPAHPLKRPMYEFFINYGNPRILGSTLEGLEKFIHKHRNDILRAVRSYGGDGVKSFIDESEWLVQPKQGYFTPHWDTMTVFGGGARGYELDFNVPANSLIFTGSNPMKSFPNEGITISKTKVDTEWGTQIWPTELIPNYQWAGFFMVVADLDQSSGYDKIDLSSGSDFVTEATKSIANHLRDLYAKRYWTAADISEFVTAVELIPMLYWTQYGSRGGTSPYRLKVYPPNPMWWSV